MHLKKRVREQKWPHLQKLTRLLQEDFSGSVEDKQAGIKLQGEKVKLSLSPNSHEGMFLARA